MNERGPVFLYGTLLPELGVPEAPAAGDRMRAVGDATVPGRLVDLGRYPGLIASPGGRERVRGRVYEPLDAAVLREFDAYEQAYPDAPDRGLFVRERVTAEFDAGGEAVCWVYRYNGCVSGRRGVASGSWAAHGSGR